MLHDTVEDAKVTVNELTIRFGARVSELVEKASEPDKSLDWRPRKEHTIDQVRTESDQDALMLIAADKLDNARSLQVALQLRGEEIWEVFNAAKRKQRWYYRMLAQTFLDREPANVLFRTLDAEVQALFPD